MSARRIKFFDTTLRDGEQTPGVTLNIKEKLEISRQLEKLGVDVIEAGFAIASPGDFKAVEAIAENASDRVVIASLSRALTKDIDAAWEAVKKAKNPRIHTFIATSDIHMQYKLKMTPEQVVEQTRAMVAYAKKYCSDIEFSAEDAGRTRPEFLFRIIETAIEAGATVVNIPDTVGYNTTEEFGNLIASVMKNVPNIDRAEVSVHCHDDLGLAVANSLAAMKNGATQIECTINGLGERAGNASLEELVMGLSTRKDYYGVEHGIETTQIYRTSKLVSSLTGVEMPPNKAVVGINAFAHESGIHQHGVLAQKSTYEIMTPESVGISHNRMVLGKLSGKHAFSERLKELGYFPSEEELDLAFKRFKELADRKKDINDRDIEALIDVHGIAITETYEFDSFQILSGNRINATAAVSLIYQGQTITEAAAGDGPVDAAFKAIDRIINADITLESYGIKAVTEGKDALGEVAVKVKCAEKVFIGRGIATDIIEASVRAYVNAVNKSLYENALVKSKE